MCKKRKWISFGAIAGILFLCLGMSSCSIREPFANQSLMEQEDSKDRNYMTDIEGNDQNSQKEKTEEMQGEAEEKPAETRVVPEYQGVPYITVNDNTPNFTEAEYKTGIFETYSELDSLNRCGVVCANIGLELMPTEERGAIGMVKPSGWHTVKYDYVDGMFLYNRCHLIGFQLTGENANENNLITGTLFTV